MFVSFDLGSRIVTTNMDNVLDVICDYNDTDNRYEMKIFSINERQEPWVWTFKSREALNRAYYDIFYKNEKHVVIKDDLA